jgi:type I restriction enzyme M protein
MVDASKGFKKDGPKNRLREQDIHRIVDTFSRLDDRDPRYARLVPVEEIADLKNDYNLNLPRYIDSSDPEDLQDIDGHLRGGIPERDLDAFAAYWKVMPGLRAALFEPSSRPGYADLKLPIAELKATIFSHPEFTAFTAEAQQLFADWRAATVPQLKALAIGGHPKPLIEAIAEELLAAFKAAPLLDTYDVYQHLMDYWAATLQDDAYLIAEAGWTAGTLPREIRQVKDRDSKLIWPEKEDFRLGRRRFKSDLVPAELLIARFFKAEQTTISDLDGLLASLQQELDEALEENSGEDGLLTEVIEGEGDKQKITAKALKARLKEIGRDPDYAEERQALIDYADLLTQQAETKALLKAAQDDLDAKLLAKYPTLSEDEIKTLVVDDKWLTSIATAVQGELDRVSQTLTGRIRQLAERYESPLPRLSDDVNRLAARVEEHLKAMGAVWN